MASMMPSKDGWGGLTWPQVAVVAVAIAGLITAAKLLDSSAREWVMGVITAGSLWLTSRMEPQLPRDR